MLKNQCADRTYDIPAPQMDFIVQQTVAKTSNVINNLYNVPTPSLFSMDQQQPTEQGIQANRGQADVQGSSVAPEVNIDAQMDSEKMRGLDNAMKRISDKHKKAIEMRRPKTKHELLIMNNEIRCNLRYELMKHKSNEMDDLLLIDIMMKISKNKSNDENIKVLEDSLRKLFNQLELRKERRKKIMEDKDVASNIINEIKKSIDEVIASGLEVPKDATKDIQKTVERFNNDNAFEGVYNMDIAHLRENIIVSNAYYNELLNTTYVKADPEIVNEINIYYSALLTELEEKQIIDSMISERLLTLKFIDDPAIRYKLQMEIVDLQNSKNTQVVVSNILSNDRRNSYHKYILLIFLSIWLMYSLEIYAHPNIKNMIAFMIVMGIFYYIIDGNIQ